MPAKVCPACGLQCAGDAPSCSSCHYVFPPSFAKAGRSGALWGVGSILVFLLIDWLLALYGLNRRLVSTPVYKQALEIAQSSPEARALLGDGIRPGWPATGFVASRYRSQFAEWSVSVRGSRGSGHLYAVANSFGGIWGFSRLSLVSDRDMKRVDLTPPPQLLSLPPVPSQKVYLIPLALDAAETLDWAPAYYRAKFGIDVTLLPPAPLEQGLEDVRRHQLISENCVDYLRKLYPDLAKDPSAILIGVTSRDIFIRGFDWAYAENYRYEGRFAIVSSARLHPVIFLGRNPEWLNSRLKKMLTKNVALLYFSLPMSSDYTSMLSGGVPSGSEVDSMTGAVIGAAGSWRPFSDPEPEVTIYDLPGKPPLWRVSAVREAPPDPSSDVFGADLPIGLFTLRKTDFYLDGEVPLSFTRVYRNLDERSRPFGIGANDSLDIFLAGAMGSYVDLILEDGGRVHFRHVPPGPGQSGDTYLPDDADFIAAVYAGDGWTVTRKDGWKLYFPYRPHAIGGNVTVLTGFADPAGHTYNMERDSSGDLLSLTTPAGAWLHFEHDSEHRVTRIVASTGRAVTYEYDGKGCLKRVADSDGHTEIYTYDDRAQMLTVARGNSPPAIINHYDVKGNILSQTMADGRKFEYHYTTDPYARGNTLVPDVITYPNGRVTYIQSTSYGYWLSFPTVPPYDQPH